MQRPAVSGNSVIVTAFIAILLIALLVVPALRQGQPGARPPGPLLIHYHYTAESVYEDVVVNETMLVSTRFTDTEHRCDQWIRQSPCWDERDLAVSGYPVTPEEAEALRGTIRSSGFMDLAGTYGGAGENQRFYPVALTAADNGTERTVLYQSFPGASPEPAGFSSLKDAVLALEDRKERRQ